VATSVDFIQINTVKRISAMSILESNVKGKIALIQEPYTIVFGIAMLHKRDYNSELSMSPDGQAPSVTAPGSPSTTSRPHAAIYAPGRSDVLPVYRFTSRGLATVAIRLGTRTE
jgi:hypothetical protein